MRCANFPAARAKQKSTPSIPIDRLYCLALLASDSHNTRAMLVSFSNVVAVSRFGEMQFPMASANVFSRGHARG